MSKKWTRDLAKRAVRCEHWRWMPGMMDNGGERVVSLDVDALGDPAYWTHCGAKILQGERLPDLDDPATMGCLEHLVREACGWSYAARNDDGWEVLRRLGSETTLVVGAGDTQAAALVDALWRAVRCSYIHRDEHGAEKCTNYPLPGLTCCREHRCSEVFVSVDYTGESVFDGRCTRVRESGSSKCEGEAHE